MKAVVLAATAALALSSGTALAAGHEAIANSTTTSMGAPIGSPEYSAPRSAVVPGLPQQERDAEARNEAARTFPPPVSNGAGGRVRVTR
jgi:hypothetical protein